MEFEKHLKANKRLELVTNPSHNVIYENGRNRIIRNKYPKFKATIFQEGTNLFIVEIDEWIDHNIYDLDRIDSYIAKANAFLNSYYSPEGYSVTLN